MHTAKRPRIAFLLSSLKIGGGERVVLNLASAFRNLGFEIDILLMSAEGELMAEAARAFTIVDLDCSRTWKLPFALRRYLLQNRPAALVSSFWKLNLCACLARPFAPATKLALWEHSPPSRSRNSPTWLYFPSASILYRLATRVIAVSGGVADDVRRHTLGLGPKIVAIFNAVPLPVSVKSIDRDKSSNRRIVWVGRFADPKNPGLMLEAFARLPATGGFELAFVGDGPLKPVVEARARELGVEERVSFLGYQPDPYGEMARADLLVVSSDREGLPTVLVEALHAGIRIVSTNCAPGVQEILMNGTYGAVVPTNDPNAMAVAIEGQLSTEFDPEKQRAGGARFDPELIVREFAASIGLVLPA